LEERARRAEDWLERIQSTIEDKLLRKSDEQVR
jgi:hypothetical protein